MRFTWNCGEAVLPMEEMNLFSIFFSFLEKNFIIGARKIIRVFSERVLQWNVDYKETSLLHIYDNLIFLKKRNIYSHAIIENEANLDISCLKWK